MKGLWRRCMAAVIAAAMVVTPVAAPDGKQQTTSYAKETDAFKPDYYLDFEDTSKVSLKGSAKIETDDIRLSGKAYGKEGNHVLTLSGGSKGSSYVNLPSDLYKGVSSDTGFTYAFWMKTAKNVGSYSRLISSAKKDGRDEFAYAPYAADKVWNVIFDDTDLYREVYETEPVKEVWNYITVSVSAEEIALYVNGERVNSSSSAGGINELKERLDTMNELTVNAIGKTCSGWSDMDCKAQVDDFSFYKRSFNDKEVAQMANETYGFDASVKENAFAGEKDIYTDGTKLSEVSKAAVTSPDGKTEVKIWQKEADGSYYYSADRDGVNVLNASMLGVRTKSVDLTQNMKVEKVTISDEKTDSYELSAGKTEKVSDQYKEMRVLLVPRKGSKNSSCEVVFRAYNDGIAFRYIMTGEDGTTETIENEASEFVLPYNGTKLWMGGTSNTYEVDYSNISMKSLTASSGRYTIPALAKTSEGNKWVLITEANVFNETDPYCSSYLKTNAKERNLKVQFGNKVNTVKMEYKNGEFHTPWRVALITDDLAALVKSNVVTDLNPDADEDTYHFKDWVKSFKADWSWWSEAGDDPIEYAPQKDYIDFAAENGWDAVCLDFGWCLWDDYKSKVKELCAYAKKKNVKIMLWYGVNNTGHAGWKDADGKAAYPTYSLRTSKQLEEQFAWAEETGVYAVKVDYYESDSQATMKQMEQCAKIAAKHKLCVLFHGCTLPGGENRTYPNILSYEAVFGEEYHKFGLGSPTIDTLLTYPYTRNVVGSMDYTPAALPVKSIPATAAFQLAQTAVYESGTLNLASSIYAYEGTTALGFLNQTESSFEKSLLVDDKNAAPGAYVAMARKARDQDKWLIGAMTKKSCQTEISLDFLGEGTYHAVLYKDNKDGSAVISEETEVTKDTVIKEDLKPNGGIAVVISKEDITLPEQTFDYLEMEDPSVHLSGSAAISNNAFASGLKQVNVGYGTANAAEFSVNAAKAGVYQINIYYKAGTDSQVAYRINDEAAIKSGLICSGTNSIAKYSCFAALKEGKNKICLYNPNANSIGIDRIGISKDVIQGEKATVSDETDYHMGADEEAFSYNYTEYRAIDAVTNAVKEAEGYVGWLGGKASSYLKFTVNEKNAGVYKMRLAYMTGAKRSVCVSVNDGEAKEKECPSTGGYWMDSLGYTFQEVELKAGSNTITLSNPKSECPNIYSIGISDKAVRTISDNKEKDTSDKNNKDKNEKAKKVTMKKPVIIKKAARKKGFMIRWKKCKGVSGYEINYGKSKKNAAKNKFVKRTKKTTITVKKLSGNKTYYVRVRSYKTIKEVRKYSSWSSGIMIRTKK